ncbi:ATP-binding protein [Thiomicrorhabdus sp. 6S2-11]|uniref:ATP-binding protein n=1 Tax=Thiomicrorhabdus marina TaxID=2818442 RepID=A0ABS3Q3F2_9GAMM|nr:AAA family ATPase [Thiomicrorhabdus marina]MBO1926633.1 ATP-binding protein [Thiomicrorhabdus marina]
MSIAGIRSNRGDIYQTLVAFEWALSILTDPRCEWMEVDSNSHHVDDIVIGKSDGSLICCQCKKNQADFRAWSLPDLKDELEKAAIELGTSATTQVRFYSRSNFGAPAKLKEFSTSFDNEPAYLGALTKEHTQTNQSLAEIITTKTPQLSVFEFLNRTSFEVTPEFDRMEALLHERLHRLVSNSQIAFKALWTFLDLLGGGMDSGNLSASKHRVTKEELRVKLNESGAILTPTVPVAEIIASLSKTSAIGRSWKREIAGQYIKNPVLDELLTNIDHNTKSILVTGQPGSGKTCVMLDLQEALEERFKRKQDLIPIFIQSREFADLSSSQEREAQGLPNNWVEQIARLADESKVVVVIDSLDVLSISREHHALTYFLAQIDQLLLIPNITVITACRDFDRKYDKRIASREWDAELECASLDWGNDIYPLLSGLLIGTTSLDNDTRELIQNPRELALFVELAQRQGSFNVVTSQALALLYLDTIVQSDLELGDDAIQEIEAIAKKMLDTRSLAIPRRQCNLPDVMLRKLLSLNILQDISNNQITFGHQTLLDVLVISGTIREGMTLNEFIAGLPPVPFVRPSIRSFITQLALGDRKAFRKQLRTVLTGDSAFHIRRLVAETFSQQPPDQADWSLIRDLRAHHKDVFQVIYTQAKSVEWYFFWNDNLLPLLKDDRDADGLTTHVYRVSEWKNEDAKGVVSLWTEALELDYVNQEQIAHQLAFFISDFHHENLPEIKPLLLKLLSMPKPDHSFLGKVLARLISADLLDEQTLWNYITGDLQSADVQEYDFKDKLNCSAHEFGSKNENFLSEQMKQSSALLDLAINAVEQWSEIRTRGYDADNKLRYGFLDKTTYEKTHSKRDMHYQNNLDFLLDSVELGILHQAALNSEWWQQNRERLSFNQESALCYFAINALTTNIENNTDIIGMVLSNKSRLESLLSYELSELMNKSFVHLDAQAQDEIMTTIINLYENREKDPTTQKWTLRNQVEYISAIPCHFRSTTLKELLESYEYKFARYIRQPEIRSSGGWVKAPFSYEVFLNIDNQGVLKLLSHYTDYKRDYTEFLVGGTREVGRQLHETASRDPVRFLNFLTTHWQEISEKFRNEILDGVATHLAYLYGNLSSSNNWEPIEKPDPWTLTNLALEELERHPVYWRHRRSAAKVLQAVAHIIQDEQNAQRLSFFAIGFADLKSESTISGDGVGLYGKAINMVTGNVAEALITLANKFLEKEQPFPELLIPSLIRFAKHENPALRALLLEHLPFLQSKNPELGWKLFDELTQVQGLWKHAERCLYYSYDKNFPKVESSLQRILDEGSADGMQTWGRISALAVLSGHLKLDDFLEQLHSLDSTEAWEGASNVFTHNENILGHQELCLKGMKAGLQASAPSAIAMAKQMENIFQKMKISVVIPIDLIQTFFEILGSDENDKHNRVYAFGEWLNWRIQRNVEETLAATELYVSYIKQTGVHFYDHDNNFIQLMNRLFAEAEEREESDSGDMLKRVVEIQDQLLSIGLNSINDWLKAAERP